MNNEDQIFTKFPKEYLNTLSKYLDSRITRYKLDADLSEKTYADMDLHLEIVNDTIKYHYANYQIQNAHTKKLIMTILDNVDDCYKLSRELGTV